MRTRRTELRFVAVAAAVAAARVLAQEPSGQPVDPIADVGEQIEAIQASQGINSPELIPPLTNLGLILREQNDVDLAMAAFERARHLVRVNYGLSSFEEAPLLRQLIQIEEAKGNAATAWGLEQRLLGLIYRYPGPRAAPMLAEIADKRAEILRQYSAGRMPPQIVLGCYYALSGPGSGDCPHSGSSRRVKVALMDEARSYYIDTIAMVLQSEGRSADVLPELYLGWVRALAVSPNEDTAGHEGGLVLREIHLLAVQNGEPLEAQMHALLRVADWDLLFARGGKEDEAALQAYVALYERLEHEGLERALIDEMFSPRVPVVLPAFMPNALTSSETPDSAGYVDVAFEITKYGQGRSVEILDTSTNTSDEARLRVRDLIRWSRFRPRVADGKFEDPARVVFRYYVNG